MPKYRNNPAYAIKGVHVLVLHINRYDEQLTKCLTLYQDLLAEIVNNYGNGEQLFILIETLNLQIFYTSHVQYEPIILCTTWYRD